MPTTSASAPISPSSSSVTTTDEPQSIARSISIIRQLSELNESLMTSLSQADDQRVKETGRADAAEKMVRALSKEVKTMKEQSRTAKQEQLTVVEKKARLDALEELEGVIRKLKGADEDARDMNVEEKAPRNATKTTEENGQRQGKLPSKKGILIIEPKKMITAQKEKPLPRLKIPREVTPKDVDSPGDLFYSRKRTLGVYIPEIGLTRPTKKTRTRSTSLPELDLVLEPLPSLSLH